MNQENRQCQNCKKDFTIESEDFQFYEKMKVPAPTWCPECRLIRRWSFSNVWNLYKRNCSKCQKSMITIFSPDKKRTVYCPSCWWSDSWDGSEYAMDYDPSKPFLQQVKELAQKTPWQGQEVLHLTNKNSEYISAASYIKDCYLIYWADFCENSYYSSLLNGLKDSLDCYRAKDSELCYEDVSINKCYKTFFSEECDSCNSVWFSRSCTGCTNCFGCINMRNKSYCIFNEQYSREVYFNKLKELKLDSRVALIEMQKAVRQFWNKYARRSYIGNSLNMNVSGDYIYSSKNAHNCFLVDGVEDSKYVQIISVSPVKDAYDYSGWGNGAEKIYECLGVGDGVNNIKFSDNCWPDALDVEYSMYASSSKHVFGCVNLKRKEYCILNKQYTKEEYEKLVELIREDMKINPYVDGLGRKWFYGEFLPLDLSPFAYNETIASQFFPKTKEEVLTLGMNWHEADGNKYSATKTGDELPDTIQVDDSVLKETIGCVACGKAYKIVLGELNLMKLLGLPLPNRCPNCRQKSRFARNNVPVLYNRKCDKCGKDIETSYAPDRPEIVYCEACYQQEII